MNYFKPVLEINDLIDISNYYWIKIYSCDLNNGISGIFMKDIEWSFIILNENESLENQKFTIAYEIWQYLNNNDKKVVYIENKLCEWCRFTDEKAYNFSIDLLMPKDLFIDYWTELDYIEFKIWWFIKEWKKTKTMANIFWLNEYVVWKRIEELWLI